MCASNRVIAAAALLVTACLDNTGPDDFPAQQINVIAAPEGEQFPTDTLDQTIAVRVTDEDGNPSPAQPVTWSATNGGTLLPTSDVTDANGEARATWILGAPPGTQTATVAIVHADLSVSISVETRGWRVSVIASSRGNHGCAIDLAGDTYCWFGSYGPIPIRIETPARFTSLATGQGHTCGLSDDERVYCWGSNDAGQLGDGTTTDRATPAEALLPAISFKSVVAGKAATCAVSITREAWCWGENELGVLGRGVTSSYEAVPAPVAGDYSWRSISTSGWATCGVDLDRNVLCWGEADDGGPAVLVPQAVEGFQADTVALSDWAKCALASVTLYCWGSETGISTPSPMGTEMRSISAGYKPIFGLGTDGLGYYWGAVPNSSYGWGDPPTPFEGGMRFRSVGGNDHSPYAIEFETSTLYTWSVLLSESSGAVSPSPIPLPLE